MRATCYLRIAKTSRGFKFSAAGKPNHAPIPGNNAYDRPFPTVLVKLHLDMVDDVFGPDAEIDVTVPAGQAEVLVEVDDEA